MSSNEKIYQLARICNNIENISNYKIIEGKCYYNDEYIGDIKFDLNYNIINIYFKPIAPVQYININLTFNNE